MTVQSPGLAATQVTQSLTRTVLSAPMVATTTAASQEAAAAIEAMEAETEQAVEGLPMQVRDICVFYGGW